MKRVLLLLSDGFEAFEAAAFTDVLGFASAFADEDIEVVTIGLHPQLHCTFGFTVVPDEQLEGLGLDDFDALAIPGGFQKAGFYNDAYSERFLDVIREFSGASKPVAAICTGGLPVARSGVLEGRRATTYHLLDGVRRGEMAEMGATVVDESIVQDGSFITSTSPATAADVAFRLLGILTSSANVAKTRRAMGFEPA